ncbi:hypothetical protein BMS3Abin02_01823 [bacterium BMS3Abin02]|nr:hypothetical protein BMS3Abin02_01823 [bacterium BMS3Abin02]HDK46013.1 hypothetical protein [Actinomycetota bacterium]HDL48336.1 hypothetical protein [Actinomycetota bacterium]
MAHHTEVDTWEVLATIVYVTGRIYGPGLKEAYGRLHSWMIESEAHSSAAQDWLVAARSLLEAGQTADPDLRKQIAATELRLRMPIDDALRGRRRRRSTGIIIGVLGRRYPGWLGAWFRRRGSR